MDSIYLMGSEDVQNAGHNVKAAAAEMTRAAGMNHDTLTWFLDQLEEKVQRMEAIAKEMNDGSS